MRNEVIIDGIRLTRDQVNRAAVAIGEPEEVVFKAGDIVRQHGLPRLVLDGWLSETVRNAIDGQPQTSPSRVRVTDGEMTWSVPRSTLTKITSLKEV
jgi:hypothetical protein